MRFITVPIADQQSGAPEAKARVNPSFNILRDKNINLYNNNPLKQKWLISGFFSLEIALIFFLWSLISYPGADPLKPRPPDHAGSAASLLIIETPSPSESDPQSRLQSEVAERIRQIYDSK